ncbi:unnamed protein product [Urochloa humidicola]
MSRLAAGDPHPRTTRKPSTGFTSAAARLLLRHGRTEKANGESIEFFSALRKCLPDPHISGRTAARGAAQPGDGKGKKVRRGSGSADEVLSLSSGIGKHDYDWLLTPPGTPVWPPAASTSGHHPLSAAAPSRLAKSGSASHGKSISRLGPTGNIGEKEKPPPSSRLSNCSSATSVVNDAPVPPGRPLRVRTSSASSINTASNASVSSTPLRPGGSSTPRAPGRARSPAQTRRRDGARVATSYVVVPPIAPSKPKPTCARARPSVSSPRSTAATTSRHPSLMVARSRLATLARRDGDVVMVARSRLARQGGGGTGSTPPPPHQAAGRENTSDNGSPVYGGAGGRKINGEENTPHRATAAAAIGSGLTRAGSRKSASTNIIIAKRAVNVNGNEDFRRRQEDSRHGGAGAQEHHRKPAALLRETRRSAVASRSRLSVMSTRNSKAGSIAGGGHEHAAAPAAAVEMGAGREAFPSTRYDAMLLREDPRNLTWLRGCDEGDEDGSGVGGIDLVDSSLELFDVATGLSRTAV